eukprot:TRINITY_DN5357_c0_g1_i3.p1 TRINITY_DN5357_c0_g1~~TRINITY_DN5357_c0_g1_i3.p1  ORF type:complete len:465 (-),score=89.24 TRINITY_DN5357_c0_g1_i3:34-1254(-)
MANHSLVVLCEACNTPRDGETSKKATEKKDGWPCVSCTFWNATEDVVCSVCKRDMEGREVKTVPKSPTTDQKIQSARKSGVCSGCATAQTNETGACVHEVYCLECVRIWAGPEKPICPECDKQLFWHSNYSAALSMVDPSKIDENISFLPPVVELEALSICNEMQNNVIKNFVRAAKYESNKHYVRLWKNFHKLGYSEKDLRTTLRYIRDEAPIIIHLSLEKAFRQLSADTHYRNQFETNTSGGTLDKIVRTTWEDRLFQSSYSKATPFERCKYGVLNIVKDPNGVACCNNYGDSYLTLKKVRLRTSFADKDSSAIDTRVASCEHYAHVLATYNEEELKAVIKVATGKASYMSSSVITVYKEVQIHGPIELSRHVESLHVARRHKKEFDREIAVFQKKNNVKIIYL